MQKGFVKWFDNRKGYGFLIYNEDEEIFVHFTAIEGDGFKSLEDNQAVEFEVVEGSRGLQAAHVKKIENEATEVNDTISSDQQV